MHQRTIWGVGWLFLLSSFLYAIVILVLDHLIFKGYRFVFISHLFTNSAGIILIAIGSCILLVAIVQIRNVFSKGRLLITGIYHFVRHPIYGAWIIFIVPGIVIIKGQVLGFTIPLAMYLIFYILIRREERHLIDLFGSDYLSYKQKVNAIFPHLRG